MASKSPEIQVLETSNKSTTTVPINKVAKKATDQSPTIKNKSNDLAMLNMLVDNKTWSYALSDLRTTFRSSKLDTSSISNYNLNYYFKKVSIFNEVSEILFEIFFNPNYLSSSSNLIFL